MRRPFLTATGLATTVSVATFAHGPKLTPGAQGLPRLSRSDWLCWRWCKRLGPVSASFKYSDLTMKALRENPHDRSAQAVKLSKRENGGQLFF
jgi:hypothetical protein